MQKFALVLCSLMCALPAYASQISADYNISRGLAPSVKGQSITTLQPYTGEFRILGTKQYKKDAQAKFSPVDYAVSWGILAHPQYAQQIYVRQYDRFLNWKLAILPVSPEQAMQMVSNIHIVPASPQIAQQIKSVKRGDLVKLNGDLVEIRDKKLVWRSSLKTDDVGEGACELFRVRSIEWLEKTKI